MMKHLGTILVLAVALFAIGCSSGGADSSATNPLADIPPIEFATFEDAAASSIRSSALQMSPEDRFAYVNAINEKLLVQIPNWLKEDLREHFNNGGDLSQPVFLENEFPGSAETADMAGKHVSKATVQRVPSSEGIVFRGIVANRFVRDDGTYADGATIDNLPVEVFFTQNRQKARVAVGYKPDGQVVYRRDAIEYNFQTHSGIMVGDWGDFDDDTGDYRVNITYEGIDFDGQDVTYWYFQDDGTDTEVLMQHDGGVSVGTYTKDTPAAATYTELDNAGTVVAGPSPTQQDALDEFESNLTNATANDEITRIMNEATLEGPVFDELKAIQNERVQW
jgi:hypothetical protein